uniref:hypothetical protein n=1 Tax=Thaumasiovibrio occultus TaxID=1891184 RepID=UPI000B361AB8|nr:hypothetical protein [Thaumasiovibrio occultus]
MISIAITLFFTTLVFIMIRTILLTNRQELVLRKTKHQHRLYRKYVYVDSLQPYFFYPVASNTTRDDPCYHHDNISDEHDSFASGALDEERWDEENTLTETCNDALNECVRYYPLYNQDLEESDDLFAHVVDSKLALDATLETDEFFDEYLDIDVTSNSEHLDDDCHHIGDN